MVDVLLFISLAHCLLMLLLLSLLLLFEVLLLQLVVVQAPLLCILSLPLHLQLPKTRLQL